MKKQLLLISASILSISTTSDAQVYPITSATTYYEAATSGNSYSANGTVNSTPGYSFDGTMFDLSFGNQSGTLNNNLVLQNFMANGVSYGLAQLAPSTVKVRRSDNPNVSGNRHIVFYETFSNNGNETIAAAPEYIGNMEDAFSGKVLNRGSDNTFGNIFEDYNNFNNVERIDVVFNTPQSALPNAANGVTVFERGISSHGAIKIALILATDGSGNPTNYSNIVSFASNDWSASNITSNLNWVVMRRDEATQPNLLVSNNNPGSQPVAGMFIPYSSFTTPAGTNVLGYSLIPADFTGTTTADILDYTNTALYPHTTDANNHNGSLDLISIAGAFIGNAEIPQDISGNVFDDGNGNTDNMCSGPAISQPSGQQLYVNLLDNNNNVLATTTVASNGSYTFTDLPANTTYTVQLNTVQGTVGSPAPVTTLPSDWVNVTEKVGTGTGTDGTPDGKNTVQVVLSNVTNVNFGINRKPVANSYTHNMTTPAPGSTKLLDGQSGNPAALAGSDAEDGTMGNGKTVVITTLPNNGTLNYNGTPVTLGQTITNYNPSLLAITFTGTGYTSITFQFAFVDAAGTQGTPASYTLDWGNPLPVILSEYKAINEGCRLNISWKTGLEEAVAAFIIEQSTDGKTYKSIGKTLPLGSGSSYRYIVEDVPAGLSYYRLKMMDIDGKYTYSPVSIITCEGNAAGIAIAPNPAYETLTVSGIKEGMEIRIVNIYGSNIMNRTVKSNTERISLSGFKAGIYIVDVIQGGNIIKHLKLVKY